MANATQITNRTYRVDLSFDLAATPSLQPRFGVRGEFTSFADAAGAIYRPVLTMEKQEPNDGDHSVLSLSEATDAGIEVHDQSATHFEETTAEPEAALDPEAELRQLWTAQGVPKARQDELIADATARAQPGAMVGPFRIGG